jgi:MFS_1 like family
LYAALFLLFGIQMPFFPVWLEAKNVDAKLIGIILAVPMVARVLAIPLVTREVDRRDAVRHALVIASLASLAGYVLVGLSAGGTAILITYTLTALFSTPLMPLAETYALTGLLARGRAYGPVRLWGSLAFIVGNFAAGFAADEIPTRHLIWLMVAASGLLAVAAWQLAPLAANPPQQKPKRFKGTVRYGTAPSSRCLLAPASSRLVMPWSMGSPLFNGTVPVLMGPLSPRSGLLGSPPRSHCSRCKEDCRLFLHPPRC